MTRQVSDPVVEITDQNIMIIVADKLHDTPNRHRSQIPATILVEYELKTLEIM